MGQTKKCRQIFNIKIVYVKSGNTFYEYSEHFYVNYCIKNYTLTRIQNIKS